jgi:hypothetical protein
VRGGVSPAPGGLLGDGARAARSSGVRGAGGQARIGTAKNAKNANGPSGIGATGTTDRAARSICVFCGSDSCCSLSGQEEQNGASRGAPSPAAFRVLRGPVPRWRVAGLGAGCGEYAPVAGRAGAFREIAQQPRPPPGEGSSRRVRRGRGHDPGEGQAQVTADVVFAKLRNDPLAWFDPGRGTTRGKDGHGSRRTWFCEIAQRPSRRVRHGRGHDPGKDGHRSRRMWFCEIAQRPRPPPGQAPPAGFGTGGGTTRGRTGTGRGGRGFAKLRNDPGLRRGRLLPLGSARAGARPGNDGHRSRRTWFLRNCATTLPPGSTRGARPGGTTGAGLGGRGFAKLRNDPPA